MSITDCAVVVSESAAPNAPSPTPPPSPPLARTVRPWVTSHAAPLASMVTAATLGIAQVALVQHRAQRHGGDLRGALSQWDARWMTNIADGGYIGLTETGAPFEWESVAFFPGYPTVVRIVASPMAILGVQDATYIAALIVSVVGAFALAAGLAVLATEIWQHGRPRYWSQRPPGTGAQVALGVAAAVLAFGAPMSIVYWMPYSESLFTALAVWALVMILRRRFLAAGVLTCLAGLTRITGLALIVTLAVVAAVGVWQWSRRRHADARFPVAATAAPFIGAAGLAAYMGWANDTVSEIGGYFAVQDRGWGSGADWGASTIEWLRDTPLADISDATATGYTITSWSIIATAALCVISVWPLVSGWLPWQIWLPAVTIAVIVLGSGGILHSRPRLLLVPVMVLLLPLVVHAIQWAIAQRHRKLIVVVLAEAGVLWICIGFIVSVEMLVRFQYGI